MLFVLCLYSIGQYNKETKCYDTVSYNSLADLSNKLNSVCGLSFSASTISRILNNNIYNVYFNVDNINKKISLNCNFKNKKNVSFIQMSKETFKTISKQNDDLLCKYYIYLIYYCGKTKDKKTDSTAEQILFAMGYSDKSGTNKSKLSEYNSFLTKNKLININKYRDNNGYIRNVYTIG